MSPLPEVLRYCDWPGARVWPTADADPLPAMHARNVVLLGDAAHPFSSFTSQGVNSALSDATSFAALFEAGCAPEGEAVRAWERERLATTAPIGARGRTLVAEFLHPTPGRPVSLPVAE